MGCRAHYQGESTRQIQVNASLMEARLAHQGPIAVSHHAPSQDAAFRGASDKLRNALDKTLGKLRSYRNHVSIADEGVLDHP